MTSVFEQHLRDKGYSLSDEEVVACEELEQEAYSEIQDLKAGRNHNLLLMEAICQGWSFEIFDRALRYSGRNHRRNQALADKWLEIQAIAMLFLQKELAGIELTRLGYIKLQEGLERSDRNWQHLQQKHQDNPRLLALLEEARDIGERNMMETYRSMTGSFLQGGTQRYLNSGD